MNKIIDDDKYLYEPASAQSSAKGATLTDGLDATVERDAARYRWLKERLLGADFDWNESGVTVLAFEFPRNVGIGGSCDKNIDAAMAANVKLRGAL